jgi:hypothetical protein
VIDGSKLDPAEVLPVRGSFRDPSGSLFEHRGVLYRGLAQEYAPHYELLMGSGLYSELADAGKLVRHEEVSPAESGGPDVWKVLRPERVPFVSYPYEWCFGQLKDAALLTLDLFEQSLRHGLWLKDASAYNVQFVNGRPVFIDTASFERYPEGSPWVAYRQFCQHFLAPLALMATRDVRLGQLFRTDIDGIPLDLASKLLPVSSHLKFGLELHIHTHARMQRKHAADGAAPSKKKTSRAMSRRALRSFIESLRGAVRGLEWRPHGTTWSEYYEGDSYEREGFEHKQELIRAYLSACRPRTLWDLGANTGVHSRLASRNGIQTIAWDFDPGAVELCYRQIVREGEQNLLPLQCDLTNPSPAIGWANRERLSMAERGPADGAMALALVHHLAIGNNVPLREIAACFAQLARHLIIEFVPKEDPKVQILLASRPDIFPDYTPEGFERAFATSYQIHDSQPLRNSSRRLYRMEARTS